MASWTLIDETRERRVEAGTASGTPLLSPGALRTAFEFELKPEGLCKGDVCIPVRDRSALVRPGGIDLGTFADLLGRPLAMDAEERFAVLGASPAERAERLTSLAAPDFTLPDLSGKLHSLSEQRGKKVLLIAYASW
jgi:hypothetical protein